MPDIKTEMSKLLGKISFDDAPDEVAVEDKPQPKRFLKGRIFDYLKQNPMSSYTEVSAGLGLSDAARVATTLKVMLDEGVLTRTKPNGVYCYTTMVDEYKDYDRLEALSKAVAARAAIAASGKTHKKTRRVANVTATRKTAAVPLPQDMKFTATVPQLLATLSVMQARELYDELKKIFGG